jgi:cell division protein FtsW
MSSRSKTVDIPFLAVVILLTATGFLIFSSAALGLLARDGATFASVAATQALLGVGAGLIACAFFARMDYRVFARFAIPLYVAALFITCLTFIPHIGLALKGAHRWIVIGGVSFQPSELLKFATVVLLSSYFAKHYKKVGTLREGFLPLVGILGLSALPLALQPDNDGILILAAGSVAVFFGAGGKLRHLAILVAFGVMAAAIVLISRPYVMDRVTTFLHPERDPSGAGYQVQQSLIAIGSGQMFGKGFGQSIQKFSYLPEPIGDSVFAVAGEEFGFAGSVFLVLLFLAFVAAGLRIAAAAPDRFGALLCLGIVILIGSQSFLNIISLIGLFPLSGLPLIFVSHGGTALFLALAESGVILSISRRRKA